MVSTRSGRSTQPNVASEKVTKKEAPQKVTAKKSTPGKTASKKAEPRSPIGHKSTPEKIIIDYSSPRLSEDPERKRKFQENLHKILQLKREVFASETKLAQDKDGRHRNLTKFLNSESPLYRALWRIVTDDDRVLHGYESLFKGEEFVKRYLPSQLLGVASGNVSKKRNQNKELASSLFNARRGRNVYDWRGEVVKRYDRARKTAFDRDGKIIWRYEEPKPVISSFCYELGQK